MIAFKWWPAALFLLAAAPAPQPAEILLWPHGAPGAEGQTGRETVRVTDQGDHVISNVHRPSITPFLPPASEATGAAVIIAPGGGHAELWIDHEGYRPAAWFAGHGIAAFVLKYRLAKAPGSTYTVDRDELADIQRAIRLVRSRAAEWHIDTARVGVLGFSAGGELAGLAAMHGGPGNPEATDWIDRESDRPDFQVLMYPGNSGCLSASKDAPPIFLAGGNNDRADISEGIARLYLAYKAAGVPAELHVYAGVGHGFGMRDSNRGAVTLWPEEVRLWLLDIGMIR